MVTGRVDAFARRIDGVDVRRDLARLHFDLAGHPLPRQPDALLSLTTLEQLHFRSDHPSPRSS